MTDHRNPIDPPRHRKGLRPLPRVTPPGRQRRKKVRGPGLGRIPGRDFRRTGSIGRNLRQPTRPDPHLGRRTLLTRSHKERDYTCVTADIPTVQVASRVMYHYDGSTFEDLTVHPS